VVVEVDSLVHIKRLSYEIGVHTILPQAACRDEIAAGRLMARRIVSPTLRRPVTLATSTVRPLSTAGRAIFQARNTNANRSAGRGRVRFAEATAREANGSERLRAAICAVAH
jgi:hypothetical protein